MVKVSVLLRAKNAERYIAEAIESVLGQTFKDWELLIVYSPSSDRTEEIIRSYTDKRIRTIFLNKEGQTLALNIGLRYARGEYVAQIDADDVWLPNHLKVGVKYLDKHPEVGAVYSDFYQIDEQGAILRKVNSPDFDPDIPIVDRINQITVIMRKQCVDAIGGYDEELKVAADSLAKLELGSRFGMARIPVPTVKYRLHPNSTTQARGEEQRHYYDMARRKWRVRLENPAVSVVVPVYNGERYIKQCIDSILNQTTPNFEIIVVDDGSIDGTRRICEAYGDQIRYLRREENLGIARTRNEGIERARGKYVCFISADDVLLPHALETFVRYAKSDPDCFYFSGYGLIDEYGEAIGLNIVPEIDYEDLVIRCVQSAREHRMWITYNIFASTKLWRDNMFDESYRFGEDLEHLLRCLLVRRIRFRAIPQPLYLYRVHSQMSTQTLGWRRIAENNRRTFRKINELVGREIF